MFSGFFSLQMSSHHIVREKQEPALIVANGAACSQELLNQLLEWSPTIVVLDGAIERFMKLGLKADVLLGDFDHPGLNLEAIEKEQYPIKIVHTPDQEKTDLEKAIEYLIAEDYPAVNIIWATGLRMDHTFANIANLVKYNHLIEIVMFDDYSTIYPLKKEPAVFKKWYKEKTPISLIPIGQASGISTQNLQYPLHNEDLSLGGRMGNSNSVAQDGEISVSFTEGHLLLMECHG